MKYRRITQREVARVAGVSQATVSIALGGAQGHGIPTETFERVMQVANELGYVPNRYAQALKTNRTMTIACVVPDVANPFYPSLVRGIQSVADAAGYDVIALNTDGLAAREKRFLAWSLRGMIDGVVGVFFTIKAPDFAAVAQAGIGIVRIETSAKRQGPLPIDNLFVDNMAAAAAATRYLMERGHRRIAMIAGIGGPQGNRVSGYLRALSEAALAPQLANYGDFNEEGGYRATKDILAASPRPTAIFAANDLMALGAMKAIREERLKIPDDIAVMGFDDIFAASVVTPALSTINQFQQTLGRVAAEMVLQRLNELPADLPGRHREMPFELVIRQSA
ncbi:LacI family DNA-binding transcriptional regulator [Methylocapsa sp. S129]|uniref:LacI family DNA-binding transcriptional regulator n=1 Tax=Methylocapsa sp. S129 TaxID=1641869 RepID=UPI00131D98C7|nr:LacI family DNA-binding transcriptional regulator [Methylocapsa sp. S129]